MQDEDGRASFRTVAIRLLVLPIVLVRALGVLTTAALFDLESEFRIDPFAPHEHYVSVAVPEIRPPRAIAYSALSSLVLLFPAFGSLYVAEYVYQPGSVSRLFLAAIVVAAGYLCLMGSMIVEDRVVEVAAAYGVTDGKYVWAASRLQLALGVPVFALWLYGLFVGTIGDGTSLLVLSAATALGGCGFAVLWIGVNREHRSIRAKRRNVCLRRAHRLFEQGRSADAESTYEQALDATSDDPTPHIQYASFLRTRGRLDDAEARARRALELDSDDSVARAVLAACLLDQDRYDEAQTHCQRALEFADESWHVQLVYASYLTEVGETTAAWTHCQRALELGPPHAVIHATCAYVALERDDLVDAEYYSKRALALDRASPDAHAVRTLVLAEHGSDDEADRHLERALEIAPDSELVAEARAALADDGLTDTTRRSN